ncbi:MAG TPA: tyrosine-type recombinase/integrase [Flavihumibacter sp.]|nr:tyrosine-type recombinase/integrase [Flavihumibacter sp.]HPZ86599.1 tyrosine-type recombinase/integrase [Flavihumibacter sp.]HQD08445.1 tyrosine-type recombinase/integrase [Flavihumibacter sp.]
MQQTIQSFGDWLYQLGYSEGTQHMLPALVREFITQQQLTDIRYVEQEKVKSFYTYLQTRPLKKRSGGALSESMIYHYVYALKTFFSWLEITGQLDYNPVSGMRFKRPQINARQPLPIEEINQLFAACRTKKETAVLHVFYSCGLRRSEGEALNTGDLHYRERLLYVRAGKGAKRRVVPMPVAVSSALENYYLTERCGSRVKSGMDEEAFFLNRVGNRMRGEPFNKLLKRILARTTVSKDTTLHHLRHSIATHLLQGGMGIEWVRDFLGHTWLETTQVYAKPTPAQLQLL